MCRALSDKGRVSKWDMGHAGRLTVRRAFTYSLKTDPAEGRSTKFDDVRSIVRLGIAGRLRFGLDIRRQWGAMGS